MPASQLKRLKADLRKHGVTGPQKSKQQKRKDAKDGTRKSLNVSRAAALATLREQSNPFEVKLPSKGPKHHFATAQKPKSAILSKPGVAKGRAEELRRQKLLPELQSRGRNGEFVDRRFGENDPTMSVEDRGLERFMKEKQRAGKRHSMFDLEGDGEDDDDGLLTHGGQALSFAKDLAVEDFQESVSGDSDDDADDQATRRAEKRRKLLERVQDLDVDMEQSNDSGRPKTKNEVMREVMAKSKLHKYERQQAKEDDDELRERLDAEMKDLFALMRKSGPQTKSSTAWEKGTATGANKEPTMNPERAALLDGKDRQQADKEWDIELKRLAQDARGMPTSRTKTEEEKAEEAATRLREREEARKRRQEGGEDSDVDGPKQAGDEFGELDEDEDEFGLGQGLVAQSRQDLDLDVEDEDDFVLDNDLIASGSEPDESSDEDSDEDLSDSDRGLGETSATDDDADFVSGLLGAEDQGRDNLTLTISGSDAAQAKKGLSFTYACPESHQEFLTITKDVRGSELITVIQRIRTLYHPKLDSKNKIKLALFAEVLVEHLVYLPQQPERPSFAVLEQLIRHIHSLAKLFPAEVGNAFRKHIILIREQRQLSPTASDLVLFTAIGEIFSTSDQFHQVVTPTMLDMACYLGQSTPKTLGDIAKGAYICTQFLSYQKLSKRVVPEVLNYVATALGTLAPTRLQASLGQVPVRESEAGFRISSSDATKRQISFSDVDFDASPSSKEGEDLKHALMDVFLQLAAHMAELWIGKSAYIELMSPLSMIVTHLLSKKCSQNLTSATKALAKSTNTRINILLAQARPERKPLAMHNHRPLPIKTSIPKFEEGYRPDKHYDPDRERAEMAKLKKEHKRERKGALRELRKDAHFIARESLRQKKVADAEYEKKYKRLVAEIQGEEAHEAKAYEKEKKLRQGKR